MSFIRIVLAVSTLVFSLAMSANAQSFPSVTKFVAPPYPPAALALRAEGDVKVLVEVDNDGHVNSAEGFEGQQFLRKASEFVAKDWIFSQSPGAHYLTLVFKFRLSQYKNPKESAKLIGNYTLQFIQPRERIITTPSYVATDVHK